MQTLKLPDLLTAARNIGIVIHDSELPAKDANLYVWTTPDNEVLYVGKSEDARRGIIEDGFLKGYEPTSITIGFIVLAHRHNAQRHALRYEHLDTGVVRAALDSWEGGAIDALHNDLDTNTPWTVPDIEMVLIRMAVMAGYPIANSAGAGQWESQHGGRRNTLAAVAVINDDTLRCAPMPHVLEVDETTPATA